MRNEITTLITAAVALASAALFGPASGWADTPAAGLVRGRVTDAVSGEALPHCNVFLANTTIGGITNLAGDFLIQNIPAGRYQLVANRVGYHASIQDLEIPADSGRNYAILLQQKPVEVGQVTVEATIPRIWRSQLSQFREAFIGETPNAKKCSIENPEILRFESNALNTLLSAYCDSTLVITNGSLGYRLHVVLESFQWGGPEGFYKIFPRFEQLEPADEKEGVRWEVTRQRTWLGSFRHFITALAHGKAEVEGFELYLQEPAQLRAVYPERTLSSSIVELVPGLGTKLHFNGLLEVRYPGVPNSMFKLNQNFVMIEEGGTIYPPLSVVLYGYWAQQRVADTLPLDYRLEPAQR